jgi:UDP-N-acetylglucosamine 2-epimerase (non-hydrolysing)
VFFVGNPMIDTLLRHRDRFDADAARRRHGLTGPYAVITLHRPSNVDSPENARRLVAEILRLAELVELVIPLHPRGRAVLADAGLIERDRVRVIDPLGYIDFMSLVSGATLVATDSGGIQEETTILGIPCLTLRRNTERPITISHGTNQLVEPDRLVAAAQMVLASQREPLPAPRLWDGRAGQRIASIVADIVTGPLGPDLAAERPEAAGR